MGPIDAFWHLANFFAPAAGVGAIASLLAKLLWRTSLRRIVWWRLCMWSSGVSAAVLIGGLLVFGRDGRMATYAVMVLGCALALWRFGFGGRRRS